MINNNELPNRLSFDNDFTKERYRSLLQIAKKNYSFVSYRNIPWGERFVLWRHDCDFSINRAYVLLELSTKKKFWEHTFSILIVSSTIFMRKPNMN